MKSIKVVIGANFGDEGKGLMTDYFASRAKNGVVVRFNGGAQAGHTVTTPEGIRHVFSHFGSGTLAGLPTFLSSFFIANPFTFVKEYDKLVEEGFTPKVYMDSKCLITTPYDMMINQIIEAERGDARHGSCGMGINETVVRSEQEEFKLIFESFSDASSLRAKLDAIRRDYIPVRFRELGIQNVPEDFQRYIASDNIREKYISECLKMYSLVTISSVSILSSFDSIIFEGAQGLMLDQNYGYDPYTTPSNTGMKNVRELVLAAGLQPYLVDITYVTRAYLTRHGAGPFMSETNDKPYVDIEDKTNVPNPYQGSLRFGIFDIPQLTHAIINDLKSTEGLNCNYNIAITCLDQVGQKIKYTLGSMEFNLPVEEFIRRISIATRTERLYLSRGPTRETITARHVS